MTIIRVCEACEYYNEPDMDIEKMERYVWECNNCKETYCDECQQDHAMECCFND